MCIRDRRGGDRKVSRQGGKRRKRGKKKEEEREEERKEREDRPTVISRNERKCKTSHVCIQQCFIYAWQVVRLGDVVVRRYAPASPSQSYISLVLYSSPQPAPTFTTDNDVTKYPFLSFHFTSSFFVCPSLSRFMPPPQ